MKKFFSIIPILFAAEVCMGASGIAFWESQYVLDTLTVQPLAAFSLRKMKNSYSGSVIQVRRSSDSTTSNIGFAAGGVLDTTSLSTFCAATSCYISTWYDQSGNGNHLVQSTTSLQPLIVSSGTVNLVNSLPSVYFSGSVYLRAVLASLSSTASHTLSAVGNSLASGSGTFVALSSTSAGNQNSCLGNANGSSADGWFGGYSQDTTYQGGTYSSALQSRLKTYAPSTVYGYVSNVLVFTNTSTTYNLSTADIMVGIQNNGSNDALNGNISEVLVFLSVLSSADQTKLYNSHKSFWAVP